VETVEVKCPYCGAENWLENQSRCLKCGTMLRRCADCLSYDAPRENCQTLKIEIDANEAHSPTALSNSVNCRTYRPQPYRLAA
jgi:hypothetical protein